jgi:hypothetical protein
LLAPDRGLPKPVVRAESCVVHEALSANEGETVGRAQPVAFLFAEGDLLWMLDGRRAAISELVGCPVRP